MKTIEIICDGIKDATAINQGRMSIELYQPNMCFIEEIPISDIISYVDNEKLLKAMIDNDPEILVRAKETK